MTRSKGFFRIGGGEIVLIALFLVMAITIVPVSAATTWTVGASGCDFTTLTDAIGSSSVVDGDTVYISAGTYLFTELTKSITIIGEDPLLVTLDLGGSSSFITGTGTIIEKVLFTNGGLTFPDTMGGATNMIIRNCIFENMIDWGYGAINLYGTNNSFLKNTFRNNAVAYLISIGGTNNIVDGNTFSDTTSIETTDNKGVIFARSAYGGIVSNNSFSNNSIPCIRIPSSAKGYQIFLNNFVTPADVSPYSIIVGRRSPGFTWVTSTAMTYTHQGMTFNKVLGNYWSSYDGTDTDGDGIGDTPYTLVPTSTFHVDSAPLMSRTDSYFCSPPVADFTATPVSGPAPLAVQFTDASTSSEALTYAWDFENDGTVDSTAKDPVFTYNNPGTFTVSLMVTNSAGSDTETKGAYIVVEKGTAAPEFPAAALPAAMIIGMLGTVLLIRRTKED